jgi:glycosyltransferase involved in cell wall biosynthesis
MNQPSRSKPLRHCMIVQNYYPFWEPRVRREADALADQGHSVDVICRLHGSEARHEFSGRVTIHRLAIGEKRLRLFSQLFDYLAFAFLAFWTVTRLHLRKRFDVVQVHNLPDFLVFSAIIPRLTGSRIILDLHDLMPEFYCSRFEKSLNSLPVRLVRLQEFLACRFAHHVITVTDLWKEALVRRGVPEKKCIVVMNLADPEHFERAAQPASRRDRLSGDGRTFRLIYHGTITHRYGVDLLLRAVQLVRKEISDISLRIHGHGTDVDAVRQLVSDLDLNAHVEVTTEFLSGADLSDLIRSVHVGIVPYRRDVFTDGILPTKLLEYVACGIPAIVARTEVISRYFADDAVEFFQPEDIQDLARHICRLYHDEDRRKQLALNSDAFNSVYNWALQKRAYVRFVEQVANGRGLAGSDFY